MRIRVSECDLCGSTTVASLSEDIVAYLQAGWSAGTFGRGVKRERFLYTGSVYAHPHEENAPGIYDALSIASVSLNSL